jgi:hypothetical protein
MKTKINQKLESMIAESETGRSNALNKPAPAPLMDAKRRALLDWRSFPTEHPFYQEGLAMEGTIAAWASGMYDAATWNDDARIFGVNPDNLGFLTNESEV